MVKSSILNIPTKRLSVTSKIGENKTMKHLKRKKYKKYSELGDVYDSPKDVVKWSSSTMNPENANASDALPNTNNSLGTSLYQAFGSPKTLDAQDSSAVGSIGSISRRTRRQLRVQRKFAHLQPCSPNSLLLQKKGKASVSRPMTEDFIQFLCLRGTASVPKELEFFNSPAPPQSPLTSDDDEYLPVSPFFKSHISCSPSINYSYLYSSYGHQLEYELYDDFSSNETSSVAEGHQSSWLRNNDFSISNCSSALSIAEDKHYQKHKPNPSEENAFQRYEGVCFEESCTKNENANVEQYDQQYSLNCISCIEGSTSMKDRFLQASSVGRYPDEERFVQWSKEEKEQTTRDIFSVEGESLESFAPDVGFATSSPSDSSLSVKKSSELNLKKSLEVDMSSKAIGKCDMHYKQRGKGCKMDAKVFENELGIAPTFRPMEQEFIDPMKYFRKIAPIVTKHGMCILVPPAGWQPTSNINGDIRFGTRIQHVHRMRNRNPETTKFVSYLHKCLGSTSDLIEAIPQIGSCEVDLLQMSQAIQNAGGVTKVNTPRKWHKIADSLCIPKAAQGRITKLQDIYYKYVLPFDILSAEEKEKIKGEAAFSLEDCLSPQPESKGRSASVSSFHRIASNAQEMYGRGQKNTYLLEDDFWNTVTTGKRHVAALSGDIDTMTCESSFHVGRSKSGWNVSSLPQSQGSLLRYLGVVPGLTTSSLKFSSVFSTSQWQKHDDNLLRIEYLHAGASRVWYAVPSSMESTFYEKMKSVLTEYDPAENASGKFLVSPLELVSDNCCINRVVQNEGHFVLCLPNVYHCVFSSGYCLTESCYFAQDDWLESRLDKEKFLLKPTKKFPAEMIILNFAKSVVQNMKRTENIVLVLQLTEAIRAASLSFERRLETAGVEKSSDTQCGKTNSCAIDWNICNVCGRPLYPLVIWKDSHFYCAHHAVMALEKENTTTKSYKMFTYWKNEDLDGLVDGLKKLIEDKETL